MYKLFYIYGTTNLADRVIRTADNAFIPLDPANTDFQEYQKWIALGNQPLPADVP